MAAAIRKACFAALFAILCLGGARAAPIEFSFVGDVTDDAINGCGGVVACGSVTGSFVFDSAAADGNPSSESGLYDASGITFFIDGALFFSVGAGSINVVDGALVDQYGLLALGGTAGNGSVADLSILLEDLTHLAFASDALPLAADLLAALLPGGFTLNALDDSFQLLGTITAIACASGCGGGQVPEPPVLALLSLGLAGLSCFRGRSRQRPG